MSIDFSVVIPTYNRMDVLPEVLDALEIQQGAPPYEIVVIDDGSSDGTSEFLERRSFDVPAQVRSQVNSGPAKARNLGVEMAKGKWVAFLGDDTVPEPGWLAAHHQAHQTSNEPGLAVIGYTGWHERMKLNPFLRYINEYGLQFGYALIEDPENVPFNFFYTSNVSASRELLLNDPFDLRFPYAAWEDIEVSYRLSKKGMRLVYRPQARVAHDHPTHLQRFMGRQEKAGYSAVVFFLLHPELGGFLGIGEGGPPPIPPGRQQKYKELLARILHKLPVKTPGLWEEILRYYYICGLHRAWAERDKMGIGGEQ